MFQSGAQLLTSHRGDWTGKRKFKSTGLARMLVGHMQLAGRIFVTSDLRDVLESYLISKYVKITLLLFITKVVIASHYYLLIELELLIRVSRKVVSE